MTNNTFEDVLSRVQRPSRYLGTEINTARKNLDRVRLKFALVFPDLYEIGTSHFGMQILYHILNKEEEIAAERVFAPGLDMEHGLRAAGIPLTTLETRTPLGRFDILGFSLLYELNFTNILTILDLAGIPFFSVQRDASHPLVIAGGPCTCNPEPVADFFDALIIGDGEQVVLEISRAWMDWRDQGKKDKDALLVKLSEIEGVYVPALFDVTYDDSGFQRLFSKNANQRESVERTIVESLDSAEFPIAPVVPYGKPIHDRLRLELARGCTRGCRFCQAGIIYRPVRERSPETLMRLSQAAVAGTGYEELSLLSLSTGDYSCLVPLMTRLMARCAPRRIAVSFPSIRAETLSPELMKLIKQVRKTGFTIAPEAGSQRLRDVINKNITEGQIIETVENAFLLGWRLIKLYFMIGLPTETREDLRAVVDLVKTLKKIKVPGGRKHAVNVSISTFIPKPHTPFQWAAQGSMEESKEKIFWLQKHLSTPGLQIKWQNPETSFLEGVWARGDRRLSRLLVEAHSRGCRFDGWTDHFRFNLWERAFEAVELDPKFFTVPKRRFDDPLPWDHIRMGVSKEFLVREWRRAMSSEVTEDCRSGFCNDCGVCDFHRLKPEIYASCKSDAFQRDEEIAAASPAYQRLEVSYSKLEDARFFGHLEMVNIFLRALRRAGVALKYSQGYHPMPKASFEDPLPMGMESLEERFYIIVPADVSPKTVVDGLKKHLPDGLMVLGCREVPTKHQRTSNKTDAYEIKIKDGVFQEKAIRKFNNQEEFLWTATDRNGKQSVVDLRSVVVSLEPQGPKSLKLVLSGGSGKRVRPKEVLKTIFHLSQACVDQARIRKLEKIARTAGGFNVGTEISSKR